MAELLSKSLHDGQVPLDALDPRPKSDQLFVNYWFSEIALLRFAQEMHDELRTITDSLSDNPSRRVASSKTNIGAFCKIARAMVKR